MLNELAPFKDHPIYKEKDELDGGVLRLRYFEDLLKKYGFEKLGEGHFGRVYEHPQYPYVFKIFGDDPGYLSYLKYIRSHQDNIYVPKLYGKFIKLNRHRYYACRMEKLNKFDIQRIPTILYDIIRAINWEIYSAAELNEVVNELLNARGHDKFKNYRGAEHAYDHLPGGIISRPFNKLYWRDMSPTAAAALKVQFPMAYEAVMGFATISNATMDLHAENVMVRGDHTLVFTDPIW